MIRVGKNLRNARLNFTSKFEVFWGFILKKPQFLPCKKPHDFHPQPQRCCPHPHLSFWGFLRVNLKWKFSRILNKPRIFKLFLCSFIAFFSYFFEVFRGFLKKSQKCWPHPHLRLWGFLRVDPLKPQIS